MCPSGASTCQWMRIRAGVQSGGFRVQSIGESDCASIFRSVMELSGFSSCTFESFASIRTLYLSMMGTSGPVTLLLAAGRDSFKMACPSMTTAPSNSSAPDHGNCGNCAQTYRPAFGSSFSSITPVFLLCTAEQSYKYNRMGGRISGDCMDSKPTRIDCGAGMPRSPFVAQGFDGVKFRGLHRGQPAADHSDDHQNQCGQHQGAARKHQIECPLCRCRLRRRAPEMAMCQSPTSSTRR